MDFIEEINAEKKCINNSFSNTDISNINTDSMNSDTPIKVASPASPIILCDKKNNSLEIKESLNAIEFKPYLIYKDECIYDENIILEKNIKSLHKQKTNYLTYQPDLSPKKRFILFDWIMEVSSQFRFKRKTYYSCINLIELYFSKCVVKINQIQLVGIACLLISSKIEENLIPQISYFVLACDNFYSKSQILKQEELILKTLKWKIQYPNLSDFGNLLMVEWDTNINILNKSFNIQDKFPLFRNDPEYKDLLFDHFFQILDYISLDYFYNFIYEKNICVSLIYIIVGVAKNIFSYKDAVEYFNNIDSSNIQKVRIYQNFFINFSKQYFKINLFEIFDVLKYVCLFSAIKFEPPYDGKNINATHEEKIQFQRYNRNNLINFQKLKEMRKANN